MHAAKEPRNNSAGFGSSSVVGSVVPKPIVDFFTFNTASFPDAEDAFME